MSDYVKMAHANLQRNDPMVPVTFALLAIVEELRALRKERIEEAVEQVLDDRRMSG